MSIIFNYFSFYFSGNKFVKRFNEKFDVVLSFSLSPVFSIEPALRYSKKFNIPCVLYCMDIWPESVVSAGVIKEKSIFYKWLYKWSKSIYSRLDKIIVSSPSFKDYFVNVLGVADKGYKMIYQPPLESEGVSKPVKYKNKFNLVYAGNIGRLQNIDLLIDAMKLIKTPDVKLHLIGEGGNLESVRKRIKEEGLENIISYEGSFPIELCEAYFKNADALLITLKNIGFVGKTIPNKAIQYMKYSKPIIASIDGDGKELLSVAKGSLLVDENPQNLANAIDRLCLMEQKEKEEMGLNNVSYFNDNLKVEKITNEIYKVLRK